MIKRVANTKDLHDALDDIRELKQHRIAERTGLTASTVYRALDKEGRGNPTLDTVIKILRAAGCELLVTNAPAYYTH